MAADKNTRRWNSEHCKKLFLFILVLIICMGFAKNVSAVDVPVPSLHIGIEKGGDPADVSVLLQIVFLLTILALAPAILIMMTSFTRLVVVFSFLRHPLPDWLWFSLSCGMPWVPSRLPRTKLLQGWRCF